MLRFLGYGNNVLTPASNTSTLVAMFPYSPMRVRINHASTVAQTLDLTGKAGIMGSSGLRLRLTMSRRTAWIFAAVVLAALAPSLILAPRAVAAGNTWSDVSRDTLALYDLKEADLAQYDPGFEDETWRPDEPVTRAEAVKWFVLGFAIPLPDPFGDHFSDVPPDNEYYQYVEAAYEAGFVNGISPGIFDPDGAVKRQQAVALLVRWLEAERGWDIPTAYTEIQIDEEILAPFSDADLVGYGVKWEMAFAVDHGIIWGDENDLLRPLDPVTRIELVSLIVHALEVPASLTPGANWIDMTPDIWLFYDVTAADLREFSRGYPDRTWRPYEPVDRKQAITMAAIALGVPPAFPATPTFTDVLPGTFFYQYIEGAYAARLVSGVSPGVFDPDGDITRLQGALFMARWAVVNKGYDLAELYTSEEIEAILAVYADLAEDPTLVMAAAKPLLAFATESGIIRPTEVGDLSPGSTLTRIDLASAIVHAMDVDTAP